MLGAVGIAGVIALYASFVLVSRWGLVTATMQPVDLIALRFGIAATVLLPVFARTGLMGLPLSRVLALAALGGLGFAAFAFAGFALAPARHGSALTHGMLPLMTALLAAATLGERPDRRGWITIVVLSAAAATLLAASLRSGIAGQFVGDLLLLAAAACWSAYGLLARREGVPALAASAAVAALSAACLLPLYVAFTPMRVLDAPWPELLLQGVVQGLLVGALSIVVYTTAVRELGAARTAAATAVVPLVTAALAVPLLDETPSVAEAVALVLIAIAVAYGARPRAVRPTTA